ncbi:dTDP-4-dehydrorhamnose reductase [Christiangramia forsetii]|uniref:dTDP-4-dehydrorhamnose reductase n=2 Tax=Christiangramia forsetii TaxID=411153 RepID=A0M6I4_CHRFK|nr:dTDP-4-dehydrorhamnose reductase [Christiangramia forsetii]GGG30339.1 NAD(P)-dependent oxidoreductase [Christiangramia forsetii]CAL68229.1 dTDP-4-dehydrorhamnose reductase [Christiangramia forsetii KT0803]
MKTILVTGANGQLGQCFQKQTQNFSNFKFFFCSSGELDITSKDALEQFFQKHQIDFCINTAAYTNVEQAENEEEKAFSVNAEGTKNIAEICKKHGAVLFHFSTDYVFNGQSQKPYKEIDEVDPINVYGASKLKGEEEIQSTMEQYFILRTSWLYSEFGHNFFRTILRKVEEKAELNITTSQIGTPTNANDLAKFVLKMISSESQDFGLYHFSNEGQATWYDFAAEILNYSGKMDQVQLNKTGFFKTLAERPEYSVLSKEKFTEQFGPIDNWKESLFNLINEG